MFVLKMHGNWSFLEAYNLPIKIRRWFIKRLVKHFDEKNKAAQKAFKK
tara:strand:+ start:3213 stop:3356 length:144 start_codon:yes stop_codon:yes gene_type:complete